MKGTSLPAGADSCHKRHRGEEEALSRLAVVERPFFVCVYVEDLSVTEQEVQLVFRGQDADCVSNDFTAHPGARVGIPVAIPCPVLLNHLNLFGTTFLSSVRRIFRRYS